MKDRIVQYPNRYKLMPVSGQTNTYDMVRVTGAITEEGTPLNKANLLTDATASAMGLTSVNPTVNDAFMLLGSKQDHTFNDLLEYIQQSRFKLYTDEEHLKF